jgi:predicted transposase YbfD/YdcC
VSHDDVCLPCPPVTVDAPAAAGLLDVLAQVTDPRARRGRRHRLVCLLAVAVLAVLAGARSFREIGDQAADLPQDVLEAVGARVDVHTLRRVAPSETTLRRTIQAVDAAHADALLCAWIRAQATTTTTAATTGLAIDGKTVRGSHGVRLFAAVTHGQPIVLAQVAVPDDTTETTQVEQLLAPLDLTGVTVTGDAAHTQTATAAYITGREGHYLLPVKGNQPTLNAQVKQALRNICTRPADHLREERGHGRITRRHLWLTTAAGVDFPNAATVLRIQRDICDLDGQRRSKQIVDFVTSHPADRITPDMLAAAARHHWGIESVHWIRDVTWGEDHQHAYTGTGVHTLAALRNLALSMLRLHGVAQIRRTLQRLHRNPSQALALLKPKAT